jgi:hypothetical protein
VTALLILAAYLAACTITTTLYVGLALLARRNQRPGEREAGGDADAGGVSIHVAARNSAISE